MRELIIKMANTNIGSLCLFLKNKVNIDYLNLIELNIPKEVIYRSLSEKIYYFVNNITSPIICTCGKHRSYIGFKNGYRTTCGNKECIVKHRKQTCIDKYGVDNPKKSKEILEKEKNNILKKWNGVHYMNNINVKEKFNNTMIENWGVQWAQQSKEISEKSIETFNNNPNREEIIKNRTNSNLNKSEDEKQLILNKKRDTLIKNWGSSENFYNYVNLKVKEKSIINYNTNHHLAAPEIIAKRVNSYYETITNKIITKLPNDIIYVDRINNKNNTDNIIKLKCLKCDNEFDINRQYLETRLNTDMDICLHCNPILHGKSNMEIDLLNFIKDNYNDIIETNTKSIISNELDIYLPKLKIGFEFNGLYWHSELYKDKNYHLNKTSECNKLGIQLIHIWEDDWIYKQDIVKSIILNKLGKSTKIYARKTEIKEIDNNTLVRDFLKVNHIQGFVGAKIKYGLFYNNELVSLMTFGSLRKSLGQKGSEGTYELLRFCNKLNTSIIGGASKLFKHFIQDYNPLEVISYSDNSRSIGNMYDKLGFGLSHESSPNYYYIINEMRYHRFNFRKDKLVKEGFDPNKTEIQIMSERGYFRIFDCGTKKWIYKK